MEMVIKSRAVHAGLVLMIMGMGSTPRDLDAQRLATEDPVLQGIWDQAIDNSHFELSLIHI